MKKITSLLTALAVSATSLMCSLPVYAAEPTISGTDCLADIGDTVPMPICISENPGVSGLLFDVSYDASKLQLVDVENTGLLKNSTFACSSDKEKNPYLLGWDSMLSTPMGENGQIATLYFLVIAEDACSTDIELHLREDSTFDENYQEVAFTMRNATVLISNPAATTTTETETTTTTTETTTTTTETTTTQPITTTTETITTTTETTTTQPTTTTTETTTTTTETTTTTTETTTTTQPTTTTTETTTTTTETTTTTTTETTTTTTETTTTTTETTTTTTETTTTTTQPTTTTTETTTTTTETTTTTTETTTTTTTTETTTTTTETTTTTTETTTTTTETTTTTTETTTTTTETTTTTTETTTSTEPSAVLSLTDTEAKIGGIVEIPVVISENPGVVGLMFDVSYDANLLKLVKVTDSGLFPQAVFASADDITKNPYNVSWDSTLDKPMTENGTIAVLQFEVLAEEACTTEIKLNLHQSSTFNNEYKNVAFAMKSNVVTISEPDPYDVNEDGKVDMSDAVLIFRIINEDMTVLEELDVKDFAQFDVTKDSVLNMYDGLAVLQHLQQNTAK